MTTPTRHDALLELHDKCRDFNRFGDPALIIELGTVELEQGLRAALDALPEPEPLGPIVAADGTVHGVLVNPQP